MKNLLMMTVVAVGVLVGSSSTAQIWGRRVYWPPHRPYHYQKGTTHYVSPRGAQGWYKRQGHWYHDGGSNPDTNYSDKEREYVQLEDPEGVYARTKGAK